MDIEQSFQEKPSIRGEKSKNESPVRAQELMDHQCQAGIRPVIHSEFPATSFAESSSAPSVPLEGPKPITSDTENVSNNSAERENLEAEEPRKKGNQCFAEEDWEGAIRHYSRCIEASASASSSRTDSLLAYSNRAEAFIRRTDFERALDDCNRALDIDPAHLKSLFRKGRALHGLAQYRQACEFLEKAERIDPDHEDLQQALRRSREFDAQSRLGKYDLSGFLMDGSAPEVSDYVGSVEIGMTRDGRGRGLYATRDLDIGDLLLVSNAVGVAMTDGRGPATDRTTETKSDCQEDLLRAVVDRATRSQKLLRQLYSLELRLPPEAPPVRRFKPNTELDLDNPSERRMLQVDVNRIRDIVACNSSGKDLATIASKYITDGRRASFRKRPVFSGLWLLPSFINHSCHPNAARDFVGDAAFVHASRRIQRGEEITIPYFDILLPLHLRRRMSRAWGFECFCKRCGLEGSLGGFLDPVTAPFEMLYLTALGEVDTALSAGESIPQELPCCAEFGKLSTKVETMFDTPAVTTPEEKNWIRASFASCYVAGTLSKEFFRRMLYVGGPSVHEIISAMDSAAPGDVRTLIMAAKRYHKGRELFNDNCSYIRFAWDQAKEACARVFGKQYTHRVRDFLLRFHAFQVPLHG